MLDIHLPHGKLQGVKEFFFHLFTITIGLLIALSLEGLVEYEHHRYIAREAEDSLRVEIAHNAQQIGEVRQNIKNQQKQLDTNLKVLAEMRAHPHAKRGGISFGTGFDTFDNMSWKTAQNTGAIAYMPYKDAQYFSDIYLLQDVYLNQGLRSIEDVGNATSLFIAHPDDWVPSPAQIDMETDRIGKVQCDLYLLSRIVDNMESAYKEFESRHK